jgi:hypothetical protein
MVSDLVSPSVGQCCIIKFLVKVKVKQIEILHRLNAQHGEETLPHESAYELHNKFSEGCKEVSNLPHAYD